MSKNFRGSINPTTVKSWEKLFSFSFHFLFCFILQYSGLISGSVLLGHSWQDKGSIWNGGDWPWLGCMQGKHTIHYSITLGPYHWVFQKYPKILEFWNVYIILKKINKIKSLLIQNYNNFNFNDHFELCPFGIHFTSSCRKESNFIYVQRFKN